MVVGGNGEVVRATDRETGRTTIRELWRHAWTQPDGRWPWARWGLALLVPVAILLWLVSLALAPSAPDLLRITVSSQVDGEPIPGARVVVGEVPYRVGESGDILIEPVPPGTTIMASADGHETARRTVEAGDAAMVVSLSAVVVIGSLSDVVSGEPIGDAALRIIDADGDEVAETTTDPSGTFVFTFIPEEATLVVEHDVYGTQRVEIGERRSLLVQLPPPEVTGIVVDDAGNPVAGAIVSGPQGRTVTNDTGQFTLAGAGQGTRLTIEREGAGSATVEVRERDLGRIVLGEGSGTPDPAGGGTS